MVVIKFKPVERRKTLAEDVCDRLRTAIMTGAVRPGEKISARSVAEATNVSFTPAREAINRLIAEGALELTGPKTVTVPILTRDALAQITKIRKSLEGLAAEIATENLSKADIDELEGIQKRYENTRTRARFQESLATNEQFHFKIYHACEMPRLTSIIESLWLQVGPSFNLLKPDGEPSGRPHRFHRDAIVGLRMRNGSHVCKSIQNDIEFGYERLWEVIAN